MSLQAILKRNTDLTPSPEEQTNLINLVSKTQMIFEQLALSPGNFDACVSFIYFRLFFLIRLLINLFSFYYQQQLEEVRCVGSFKKATMRAGHNLGDLVVILKTLPILEAIKSLGDKAIEELKKMDSTSVFRLDSIEGGFDIVNVSNGSAVRILITTILPNMRKIDPSIHLPVKLLQKHMSAIRHVRWFEESANLTTVKVLIRVLRDVCSRFEGLSSLTPWIIDVLAHYSVTFRHPQQMLPLNAAFKRVLQLLAGGLFLPGSTSIPDPCENGTVLMHSPLSLQQLDTVCMTAQTLLRILSYGCGYKVILGLEEDVHGITINTSVWDGVVVAPSSAAFEVPSKEEESTVEVAEVETEAKTKLVEQQA